ncbi:hypothetical protein INP83_16730 [Mucilaginibacter sp. 21P]|uniref:LGFP repeat-containing protein n=1 Tax=Mucilaginibacter sp. 21P TaxID=2778902 RepID=UPI001C562BED|nr:hypothetical protein [Mucilaginibacter sp. 21P]QXV64716.1 hypothetical protein INP83_16730 [Mucilaginibacter sp. 21P]
MSAIDEKYDDLFSQGVDLGAATTDEILLADGVGSSRSYDNGTIYYHPDYGAFEVNGDILARYIDLGAEQSSLGYPLSDEQDDTTDNATIGRKSEFVNGVITWTTTDGAIEAYYDNSSNTSEEGNNTTEDENKSEEENNTTEEENTTAEESNNTEEETPTEPSEIDTWLSNDYPTRKITVGQALQIVDHLINEPDAQLQINGGAVNQTNVTTVISGNGETKAVVRAYRIKPDVVNGIQFKYLTGTTAKVIGFMDNIDPRMIVFLYKMTAWFRDFWGPNNNCTVTEVHHIGIGHGNPNHLFDCHNTGRAIDFGGLAGTLSDGSTFTLNILNDWGKKPEVTSGGKTCFRLQESDGLIYNLARDYYGYAMQHCQDKSQNQDDLLSDSEQADRMLEYNRPTVSSFICHPDHPDASLRKAHANHYHVQIGATNYEANPPL